MPTTRPRSAPRRSATAPAQATSGCRLGRITAVADDGRVSVDGAPVQLSAALTLGQLRQAMAAGQPAVVLDGPTPLLLGLLQTTASQDLALDGRHVAITAGETFSITCGKASITLTRSGKVVVRGADVLTRSSGLNRVKGGSVQIN